MEKTQTDTAGDRAQKREVVICNRRGLHARAAAKFVKTVEGFDAEVTVIHNGIEVSGRSIMGLMMLAAANGTTIEVSATGPEAAAALDAAAKLIADRFEEGE